MAYLPLTSRLADLTLDKKIAVRNEICQAEERHLQRAKHAEDLAAWAKLGSAVAGVSSVKSGAGELEARKRAKFAR